MAALDSRGQTRSTTTAPGGIFKSLSNSLNNGISTPRLTPDNVPDDAMVLSLWLESCTDLSSSLSLDGNGLADPEVVFELNTEYRDMGNQTQKSSTCPKTLNPRWAPPEKFQFVIEKDVNLDTTILMCMVADWDRFSANEPLGTATISIEELYQKGPIKEHPLALTLHHPESNEEMPSRIYIRAAMQPKDLAFAYHEEYFYEIERWQPLRGWGHTKPGFLLPTDPHRFFSVDGSFQTMSWNDIIRFHGALPTGYDDADWHVVPSEEPEGWRYGTKPNSRNWESRKTPTTFCRRRVFMRRSTKTPVIAAYIKELYEHQYAALKSNNAADTDHVATMGKNLLQKHL